MGSIFINAGLAAGVALAAIPIILHLFMKQQPKSVIFPALRLIRERQKRSKKTLKIKNWLLLLARMGLIALMALALARPRVDAKVRAGSQEVETALAMVFDTSLSMGYAERDRSTLDEAKERAEELLSKAHSGSQVFVIDTAEPGMPPPLSPAAARERIKGLKVRPATTTLNQALGPAYRAVAESDRPRHEVYVFSDLARSSWRTGSAIEGLDEALKEPEGIDTFLVRVGPEEPYDAAIVDAEPTSGLASQGEPVPIRVRVRAQGRPANRVVEFYVDGQKKAQQVVEVPANSEVDVPPFAPRLDAGLHRVTIRLAGEPDPLAYNDERHLTFDVQPSLRVLVVTDRPNIDDFFVVQALDPVASRNQEGVPRPFQVEQVGTASLPQSGFASPLREYAGVFLLDVAELPDAHWRDLADYVKQGGGLVIGVGDRVAARIDHYNDKARALLPGQLGGVQVRGEGFTFGRADLTNALFAQYGRDLLTALGMVPVFKTLVVEPTNDARTLLAYGDETPALLERVVQGGPAPGRVLLWTTALTRSPDTNKTWNELPVGSWAWAFVLLMDQTVPYLAGTAGRQLSIDAGETVALALDPTARYTDFNAKPPGDAEPIRLNEPSAGGPLVVTSLTMTGAGIDPVGHWTVTASRPGGAATLGFSVNPPAGEAELAMIERAELDGLFGEDNYALAGDAQQLKEEIQLRTVGREIFPWLMFGILLLVTAENALANTFYRDKSATPTPAAARA